MNKMNKKASLADSVLVPAYILAVAMTMFIAYYVWTTFASNFTPIATGVDIGGGENLTRVMTDITTSISYLDYMFPLMVVGLLLVSLIFAYKTGSSIVYAFVSVFMWVLALIMSAIYTNTFEMFASNFATVGGVMTITAYIMANIKWVVLAWAFLISLVMFTRSRGDKDSNPFAATETVYQ